jgi:hypothetical protein
LSVKSEGVKTMESIDPYYTDEQIPDLPDLLDIDPWIINYKEADSTSGQIQSYGFVSILLSTQISMTWYK